MNDPIADLLARIRNAQLRNREDISVPSTKVLVALSKILKEENFINDYSVIEAEPQNELVIKLRYVDGQGAVRGTKRVSKPGVRRYIGYRDVSKVLNGLGVSILSTSHGVMTGQTARKSKIGGELLCEVW
jgi:small subunit ribosomal protein S8